ncbi:hypothetical protein glysoja_049002 [Glycine soja]|uniref:Uncharacterized protein n=1 Tax=Glycine soja TaxID=3848 RepID=A0A0B2Q8R0_GLYSO|nr:hypothetical protein glysoja_049002 [Glycine soja]
MQQDITFFRDAQRLQYYTGQRGLKKLKSYIQQLSPRIFNSKFPH